MSQPQVLFPIAVEPEALSDHPTDQDRLIHREVVTTLGAHGILALPEADKEALFQAVGGLGDLSKTLWIKQLGSLNDLNRLDLLRDAIGVGERLRHDGGHTEDQPAVRVFVASRATAELYSVDDASGFKTIDDSDVVLASTVDRSPTVTDANNASVFPKGENRSAVESSFIQPLAARSSAVKVIDPYILEGVIRSTDRTQHAEWLVQTLADTMPEHSTLSILGKLQSNWQLRDRERDEARVRDFLNRALRSRTQPMTILVRLSMNYELRNRYIWFSSGHSFDVLHDFDALKSTPLKDELRFERQSDERAQQTLGTAEKMENHDGRSMVSVKINTP